jgi:hypothetical protein
MAEPLKAGMPPALDLPDGYIVTWAAIDATTGADVGGVVVSNVSLFGTNLGTGSGDGTLLAADNPILVGISV